MEITFKADKKHRDRVFTPNHFAHPAKMILPLQRWIIDRYTKPGDVVLDPMAGSGTLIVATQTGRHVVLNELEAKYIKMIEDNWAKIQTIGPEMGYEMGTAQIIQGDARNLEGLFCDAIVTSPPYVSGGHHNGVFKAWGGKLDTKSGCGQIATKEGGYGDNPDNIGNLKYGDIDCVISSPPYEGSLDNKHTGGILDRDATEKKFPRPYTDRVDTIITSPPYEGSLETSSRHTKGGIPERDKKLGQTGTYADLKEVDAIIASPPYEASEIVPGRQTVRSEGLSLTRPEAGEGYNRSNDKNIGNLKGQSYLQAMLQVYRGCHSVLKPQGLMILVTKNFIRDKQEIRLDEDTISLCQEVGFEFVERHYRKLTAQSFWRVIALQKCDHRRGDKDNPKCTLGLTCPFCPESVKQLSLLPMKEKKKLRIEQLCLSYINSSPEINKEDILVFSRT